MESKRQWMASNRLKTIVSFRSLFPGNDELAGTIGAHMQEHGFDESQPIVVWDRTEDHGRNALYVVDGHTRLVAAKQIGLSPVYVARMKFADEREALEYAIHCQRDRRNITDADILRCVEAVDKLKSRGGDRKSKASSEAIEHGKSAEKTAQIVGTSRSKVEKSRSILKRAGKLKNAVLSGKKSIHGAYKETQQHKNKRVISDKKQTPLADMDDFKELEQAYENFLNKLIGFDVNHREQKKLRKEYQPILSGWAGNLRALIDNWAK